MPHTYELRYCACGETLYIRSDTLTKQCNNHWKKPESMIWDAMKRCCYNPKWHAFKHYGGRGIKVCKRWKNSFVNFLLDMGERPKGMTLERININKNYSLSNC